MRTLKKNFLLYCCDFLRVLVIKIPVNLVMTKRGRWVLIALTGPAIALVGLHFWNSAETIFVPAPDQVERIIEEQRLGIEVVFTKDKIIDINAKIYLSAEEFVKDLKPGQRVLAGYYLEELKRPGRSDADISNLAKVYSGQGENKNSMSFRSHFPDLNSYFIRTGYDKTGLALAEGAVRNTAVIIWFAGGFIWIFALLVVGMVSDQDY